MYMKYFLPFVLVLLFSLPLFAEEELPVLWLEAGKTNEFQTIYTGQETDWSLKFGHRTLESGKLVETPGAQAVGHRILKIKAPSVKEGVQMYAVLDFGKTPYRRVVIVSPEPFESREDWFNQHPIALYDPEKTTIEIFEEYEIPFKLLKSFAEIEAVENAVIIIGQEVDFDQETGLSDLLYKKAVRGGSVLVAAPKGNIPLDFHPSIHSFELRADAKKLFPLGSTPRGGENWAFQVENDRTVLASEFIRPYGSEEGKVMGIGPSVLDIRFAKDRGSDFETRPQGRIIFDKRLHFSHWKNNMETRYYFKSLIEQLTEKSVEKGESK